MSAVAQAKTKGKKKPSKPAAHPTYVEMISAAICALKERGGSSKQAILKYITAHYKVGDGANVHLKQALRKGVASGVFKQPKGKGASGSFKLAEKPKKAKKPKTPKKKKAAKKPAKKAAKKKTTKKSKAKPKKAAAKKPAAKKAAKKPAKKAGKKTPKKSAKKSAAKK